MSSLSLKILPDAHDDFTTVEAAEPSQEICSLLAAFHELKSKWQPSVMDVSNPKARACKIVDLRSSALLSSSMEVLSVLAGTAGDCQLENIDW